MILSGVRVDILDKIIRFISSVKKTEEYPYLIEIRPMLEKKRIKRSIKEIKSQVGIKKVNKVPHITLVYNFRPKKGVENYFLAEIIRDVTAKYSRKSKNELVKFHYDGFELKKGKNGYVLAFRIKPSPELRKLRKELYDKIKPYIEESPEVVEFNQADEDNFWFHATISHQMSWREYKKANKWIHSGKDEYFSSYVLRITLLRKRISYEYDTATESILKRSDALSKGAYKDTLREFRIKTDVEVASPTKNPKRKTWVAADTHFKHRNIIKYCGRPFLDEKEMDDILRENWNSLINKNDIVYFLGDISLKKHNSWLKKLNGKKMVIRGNHEPENLGKRHEVIDYKGYRFSLIHNPKDVTNFNGWSIHGHAHNKNLRKYPLINGQKKTINISMEVTNYKPISLDHIISLRPDKIKSMETILDKPEYKNK